MWTTTIWLHLAPYGSIFLKGVLKNIKNAAVYFYCSPFSFSSICLPYVYVVLLGACTHSPFMRTASLTKIKNYIDFTSATVNYFKYVISLVFKLDYTQTTFLHYAHKILLYISFWFYQKKSNCDLSAAFFRQVLYLKFWRTTCYFYVRILTYNIHHTLKFIFSFPQDSLLFWGKLVTISPCAKSLNFMGIPHKL